VLIEANALPLSQTAKPWNIAIMFGVEKLEWWGYPMVEKL